MTAWLTHWLAGRLSPAEREAVLGDAAERATAPLRDVASLLLWREMRAWTTAAPWMALVTLVVPLGFVLSVVARGFASGFALFAWIYVNNWTSAYLTNPGARLDLLVDFVWPTILKVLCLVVWSWTGGRTLRVLSHRAVGSNALVLTAVVMMGTLGTTTIGILNPANAPVYSSAFYRDVIPFIARFAFVLVPLWYGVAGGDTAGRRWTLARSIVSMALVGATFRQLAGAAFEGWIPVAVVHQHFGTTLFFWAAHFEGWRTVALRLLFPVALAWPAAYLLLHDRRRIVAD